MLHVICTRRTLRLRTAEVEPAPPPPPVARCDERRGAAAAGRVVPAARSLEEVVPSATPRALLAQAAAAAPAALPAPPAESDSDSDDGYDEPPPCASRLPAAVAPAAPTSAAWDQQLADEPPDDCLQLEWAAGLSPLSGVGCCASEVRRPDEPRAALASFRCERPHARRRGRAGLRLCALPLYPRACRYSCASPYESDAYRATAPPHHRATHTTGRVHATGYLTPAPPVTLVTPVSPQVVYATGSIAVVHSVAANAQRHFCSHRSAVRVLAFHPDGRTVASASALSASDATADALWEVLVWDAPTATIIAALPDVAALCRCSLQGGRRVPPPAAGAPAGTFAYRRARRSPRAARPVALTALP